MVLSMFQLLSKQKSLFNYMIVYGQCGASLSECMQTISSHFTHSLTSRVYTMLPAFDSILYVKYETAASSSASHDYNCLSSIAARKLVLWCTLPTMSCRGEGVR